MGHVMARVSGLGWTLLPFFPFRFVHEPSSVPAVRVERRGPSTTAATVFFEPGGPRVELAPGTVRAADVVDLTPSPFLGEFRVETSVFSSCWPAGFEIVSSEPGGPSPFDFVAGECLVYVQGPLRLARCPKVEAMCGPGQQIVGRGAHAHGEWVELAYEHDGHAYWQRHTTAKWGHDGVLIVTAQSPANLAVQVREAAASAFASLQVTG